MELSKREKKWLGWLGYGLYLIVFCEMALGIYLIYFAGPDRFDIYASRSMLEARYGEPLRIPHLYLGVADNPKYAYGDNKHNNDGFRGEEILANKPDSVFRIVCIGGSTTYGSGVENYKHTYPYLLNEVLAKKGIEAEVINAGSEGYNSLQSYINYVTRIEDLSPDMLILYHAINDVRTRAVWPTEYYKADQSGLFIPRKVSNYNYLRKLSIVRVPFIYLGIMDPDIARTTSIQIQDTNYFLEIREQLMNETYPKGIFERVPIDSMIKTNRPIFFERNIERLINEARFNDTQVVLSTFIYSDQFPDDNPELSFKGFQNGIKEHNDILRGLSQKHNLPLIDLAKDYVFEKELFTDGIHFNKEGNQKRVEKITEFLIPMIQESEANNN